jgi:hypothetical protein
MGIYIFRSNSCYDEPTTSKPEYKNLPMPDPNNYIIKRSFSKYGHLLIEINYPDCINYEGNKILLYKDTTLNELKEQKHIDPHFSENKKFKSPVARFEPTKFGWDLGMESLFRLNQ